MNRIIGIDLGTSNCCAAYTDETGKVWIVPYKDGSTTIPSVYAVDSKGRELVGLEAKRQWQLNPENTVYASKRLIGRAYRSEVVEAMEKVAAYKMKPSENGEEVLISMAGRDFGLSEIASKILSKVRDVASAHLNENIDYAVVTVPAYFTDKQRQAVKDAGELADLNIVRIINEPTAAALAYGVGRSLKEKIAVYDLGGGTFDVSIIEIRDRVFEVKATGGDIFLGGLDFDYSLIHYLLDSFREEYGVDLSTDPVAMQRIKDLAERTKIDLSSRESVVFGIPFITMTPKGLPLNMEYEVNRSIFADLTADLVDRSLAVVMNVLEDAEMSPDDIDEVILVGGQSRMPLIHEHLTKLFGKRPSKGVHPDEAVAVGAALYAHSLHDDTNLRIQLLDVIPMAIGIEAAGERFHEVFERNASIPNARLITGTTSFDDQSSLAMRIYQGDSEDVGDNELLGEFMFEGIRPGPAGSVQVEVKFDINIEGILTMSARDPDTGKEMNTTVNVKRE